MAVAVPPCSVRLLFESAGSRLVQLGSPDQLEQLLKPRHPVWLRILGLGESTSIHRMLDPLQVAELLLPPLLEVPQRPRVNVLDDALLWYCIASALPEVRCTCSAPRWASCCCRSC